MYNKDVTVRLDIGNCREVLAGIENEYDAIVTDPPYGLGEEPEPIPLLRSWIHDLDLDTGSGGFMGAKWDAMCPNPSTFRACLRALKPGGKASFFAGTRTVHLMMSSLKLAGFEVVEVFSWVYGQGFPKSLNVYKSLKKKLAADGRYDVPGAARCKCEDDRTFLLAESSIDGGEKCAEGHVSWVQVTLPWRNCSEVHRVDDYQTCADAGNVGLAVLDSGSPDKTKKQPRSLLRDDYDDHKFHTVVCSWCLNPMERDVDDLIAKQLSQDDRYTVHGAARCSCVGEDYEYSDELYDPKAGPDLNQSEPRKIILDDYDSHGLACRVCSWCLLPDDQYVESIRGLGTALKPAWEPIIICRKPEGPIEVDVESILESYGFDENEIALIMTPPEQDNDV